jgi:hypothetical protein
MSVFGTHRGEIYHLKQEQHEHQRTVGSLAVDSLRQAGTERSGASHPTHPAVWFQTYQTYGWSMAPVRLPRVRR